MVKWWSGAKAVSRVEFETQQQKLARLSAEVMHRHNHQVAAEVADPVRLAAVYGSAFASANAKRQAEVVALMAASMLKTANARVSLVMPDRQVAIAAVADGKILTDTPDDPIKESFCKNVIGTGREFAVDDSGTHPLVCDSTFTTSGVITSYLGVPIANPDNIIVGVLCVFDAIQRDWHTSDVTVLTQLSYVLTRALSQPVSA